MADRKMTTMATLTNQIAIGVTLVTKMMVATARLVTALLKAANDGSDIDNDEPDYDVLEYLVVTTIHQHWS